LLEVLASTKGWIVIMDLNVLYKWCSSMLDQQALEKENVPPQHASKPNRKRSWIDKVATTNNKGKWKNQTLEEAMNAIERRMCSLMVVNRNIPLTSLLDHLSWKTRSRKRESIKVLTNEGNVIVVAWILVMQKCGLPITFQ